MIQVWQKKEIDHMFSSQPTIDNYKGLWGSTLSALDCFYVTEGLKRCSIDFMNESKIPILLEYCEANHLCVELSNYKIISLPESSKGGFSNSSTRVSKDSPHGNYAVFLSKDRMDAQLAKYYYTDSKHDKLGPILGYPKCCINFFNKYASQASKKNMDFILYALSDTQQHQYFTNRALRYFGISLISHFPCSLECQSSMEIGKRNLEFLYKDYPQIAEYFITHLKSLVIYTESQGVHFSNNYIINGNAIEFEDLKSTVENELHNDLVKYKNITLINNDKFKLGSKLFHDDVGILLFK